MPARHFGELANYIDLLLDAVCVVDINGKFVYVSAGCERVFGYRADEMIGRNITDMLHPDDYERTVQAATSVMQGKQLPYFENRYLRKDGSIAHIMWSARWSADDKLRIAVARDISSKVRYEAKQRATFAISEAANNTQDLPELFARVQQIVSALLPIDSFSIVLPSETEGRESICYAIPDDAVTARDQPGVQSTSLTLAADIIHNRSNLLHHTRSDETGVSRWLAAPLRRQDKTLGVLLVSRRGHQNFNESDEELLQFVSAQIASAVERQQMITRLQQLALHDALTQLPNRVLFEDRMRSAMARARRDNRPLCLLYIDLDRFKEINDQYGHDVGDRVLIEVAARLKACLRECDTVARLGGDEFVILLESIQADDVQAVITKFHNAVSLRTIVIDSHPLQIRLSIGAAVYPENASDFGSLIRHADRQMYEAKRASNA